MTNNKELFMKWIKNLFYVQCATLVAGIITALPFLDGIMGWINTILAFGTLFVFFKLSPVKDRYRKATIFMAVTLVINLISKFTNIGILTFVGSIFSLIALYQEYSAHSDMMDGVDDKLARKWHTLFNWQIIGGIVLGFLESVLSIVLVGTFVLDANFVAGLLVVMLEGFDIIIKIVYLMYLKRMLTVYENYEPRVDMHEEI